MAAALFAVVQPPQKSADGAPKTDGAQYKRPRHRNGQPGHDDEYDGNDSARPRPRNRDVAQSEPLRTRSVPMRYWFKHRSPQESGPPKFRN